MYLNIFLTQLTIMTDTNIPRKEFIDSDSKREHEAVRLEELAEKSEREWGDEGSSTARMYRNMARGLHSHSNYGSLSLFGND